MVSQLIPVSLAHGIVSAVSTTKAPFTNNNMNESYNNQGLLFYIILILLILLIMWIGSFVFNESVVKIFPSTKKVSTLDFFGLYIVTHLLFC